MKVLIEWCSIDDGRWVSESRQVPGTRICSDSKHSAVTQAQLMVMRALADQFEAEGSAPVRVSVSLSPTASPDLGADNDADIAYDRWLAAEVIEAMEDEEVIPHAEAMRLARAAILDK